MSGEIINDESLGFTITAYGHKKENAPNGSVSAGKYLPMGGKTLNLMELAEFANKRGFTIPAGYGLGYDAHMHYIEHNNLPSRLIEIVLLMKERLGGNIAIRSSGNVEDGSKASAAGVFESLYIRGTKVKLEHGWEDFGSDQAAVEYVVRKIYDTTRSDGAIEYFAKNDVKPEDIKMGLSVQRLLETPIVAGVILASHGEEGKREVYANYVVNDFGNVIADGHTPGSSIFLKEGVVLSHVQNFDSRQRETMSELASHITEGVVDILAGSIMDSYEYSNGDIEFAIDKNAFIEFMDAFETEHKDEILSLFQDMVSVDQSFEPHVNKLFDGLMYIADVRKNETAEPIVVYLKVTRRVADLIDGLKNMHALIQAMPDNHELKTQYGKILMKLISVLQYRNLVRPMPKYNPNARGSLSSIYNPDDTDKQEIDGVVVRVEDFKSVHEIEAAIKEYKAEGLKVIFVGKSPAIEHEHALALSHATLLERSGSGSHIALRAGEWKKPAIGGCKTDHLHSGLHLVLDSDKMTLINQEGHDILEPLFTGENINQEYINEHLAFTEQYIFTNEPTVDEAKKWLHEKIAKACDKEDADILSSILEDNCGAIQQATKEDYEELGFDSCQTNRKLSKIIAQVMLIGGYIYESEVLGYAVSVDEAITYLKTDVSIRPEYHTQIIDIAKKYGSNQEFLYPGVTPSTSDTKPLKEYIDDVLMGKPSVSVRAVTGVGGIRNDKLWNEAVDFQSFLSLKIGEDKRYYPGVVLIRQLCENEPANIPAIQSVKNDNLYLYEKLIELRRSILSQKENVVRDVAMLCSAYLPGKLKGEVYAAAEPKSIDNMSLRLLQAYHSPRSELDAFLKMLEQFVQGEEIDSKKIDIVFHELDIQIKSMQTFNSTLHIPWASGLASIANGMIGNLRNRAGNSAIRYGVGREDKSFEIVQYDLANGKTSYVAKIYNNKLFGGKPVESFVINAEHPIRKEIEEMGFLQTAINYLGNYSSM